MKHPAAKYIRIYSDIHLDFDVPPKKFTFDMLWMPEILETDKDTILILAGDIWHASKPFAFYGQSWFKEISKRFQYIIVTLGNHDFWDGNFPLTYNSFSDKLKEQELDNVFLLQNETILIGDLKFVGGTLWTDFDQGNTHALYNAKTVMNDYKYIRYGKAYGKLTPSILLNAHMETKNYIFSNAKRDYEDQKVWVISHHAPSYKSMDSTYDKPDLALENSLYFSNLDKDIENSEIDFWIHGHSHHAKNYMIGNTNVIANPRGYRTEETEYNPWILYTA